MIRVQTSSRLHFGLLNAGGAGTSRRFGGVGLMILQPGWCVSVAPAPTWSAAGPSAERALSFAERFARVTRQEEGDIDLPPRRVVVERSAPEHAGLGSGTQLGLAVARALALSWGRDDDLLTLARRTGRGLRSALGAHGFEHGGFLIEAGKSSSDGLAPLAARLSFPDEWRIVLALPAAGDTTAGLHGPREREAFAQLAGRPDAERRTEVLCRLVLLGLLPALVERDLDVFGEALHEFNVRAGEPFAPLQGGAYASPRVAEVVSFLRCQGVRGTGQSSWGPAVFAVVADETEANRLAGRLRDRFTLPDAAVLVTPASNHGAIVQTGGKN